MDAEIIKIAGQVAGIGGLAIGAFLILFRDVIRKNIFPNLTREQAYRLIRLFLILAWSIAIAGIAAWVYANTQKRTEHVGANSKCGTPYLSLKVDDRIGTMNRPSGYGKPYARRFRFSVGNPTSDCTVLVTGIYLDVLDQVEDKHGPPEGITVPYKYQVSIGPQDLGKTIQITEDHFKLTPHDVDEFEVNVYTKEWGYDYVLRFSVKWQDILTRKEDVAKSWVVLAPFPKNHDPSTARQSPSSSETGNYVPRQKILKNMRQRYDNSEEAIIDAEKENKPIDKKQRRKLENLNY